MALNKWIRACTDFEETHCIKRYILVSCWFDNIYNRNYKYNRVGVWLKQIFCLEYCNIGSKIYLFLILHTLARFSVVDSLFANKNYIIMPPERLQQLKRYIFRAKWNCSTKFSARIKLSFFSAKIMFTDLHNNLVIIKILRCMIII